PAPAGGGFHRLWAKCARQAARRGAADRARSAGESWTEARIVRLALPARIVGRPEAARQRGTRARALAAHADPGRSSLGARQVDRGAGAQPAALSQAPLQSDLRVHLARPQRRAIHLGPRAGDVSRTSGRDRPRGGDLRTAETSLYARAARLAAEHESGRADRRSAVDRRSAQSD